MSAATTEERTQMAQAVSDLRRQYAAGLALVEDEADDFWSTAAQIQVWGAMKRIGPNVETWSTTLRQWAEAGRKDTGSAYTVAEWLQHGRNELAEAIKLHTGVAYNAGLFSVVAQTATATTDTVVHAAETVVDTAKAVADVGSWSLGTKLAVGAVALAVVAVAVAPVLRAVGKVAGG